MILPDAQGKSNFPIRTKHALRRALRRTFVDISEDSFWNSHSHRQYSRFGFKSQAAECAKKPRFHRVFPCCHTVSRILFMQPFIWDMRYRIPQAALFERRSLSGGVHLHQGYDAQSTALHTRTDLAVSSSPSDETTPLGALAAEAASAARRSPSLSACPP